MTKSLNVQSAVVDKLQNSTSNVGIQRQRLEKIIKVWLIESRDSKKKAIFLD